MGRNGVVSRAVSLEIKRVTLTGTYSTTISCGRMFGDAESLMIRIAGKGSSATCGRALLQPHLIVVDG